MLPADLAFTAVIEQAASSYRAQAAHLTAFRAATHVIVGGENPRVFEGVTVDDAAADSPLSDPFAPERFAYAFGIHESMLRWMQSAPYSSDQMLAFVNVRYAADSTAACPHFLAAVAVAMKATTQPFLPVDVVVDGASDLPVRVLLRSSKATVALWYARDGEHWWLTQRVLSLPLSTGPATFVTSFSGVALDGTALHAGPTPCGTE